MPIRRSRGGSEPRPVPGDADETRGADQADPPAAEPARAAPLPPDARPRISSRCAWQVVEGEAVLLDLAGRRIMGLNPVGSFVFGLMDGARSVEAIAAAVAERFRVDVLRAHADVSAFLEGLSRRGLVEVEHP